MLDLEIKLEQLAINLHMAKIGQLAIYYSYATPIAYSKGDKTIVCENIWTATTARHIAMLKGKREKREVFLRTLQNTLELYGLDRRMVG